MMNENTSFLVNLGEIEKKISYAFSSHRLLETAFIHRSFANENSSIQEHNERLEFLGDAVLGFIITEKLYLQYPDLPEGELSHLRSLLVDANSCTHYIENLHLEPYLLLGRGEKQNRGRGRKTILANLFEAIIGAIYLDGGFDAAKTFFFHHFSEDFFKLLQNPISNWKAKLQDFCQKTYHITPNYHVIEESGPDHNKIFHIAVFLQEKKMGEGSGNSKKIAQQNAAKDALDKMETKA